MQSTRTTFAIYQSIANNVFGTPATDSFFKSEMVVV